MKNLNRKLPWEIEPDRVEFLYSPPNSLPYKCMIIRNHVGALCGYVFVPNGMSDKVNENIDRMDDIEVHGGITFSKWFKDIINITVFCLSDDERKDYCYVVGFDCCHYDDVIPAGYIIISQKCDLDFYMNEYGATYKDIEFVKKECEKLAKGLHEILSNTKQIRGRKINEKD